MGRGTTKQETLEAIHEQMRRALPIDRVEVCYHPGQGASECDCRKPKPGMLLRAARDLGIDLARSFMVGDRWRDINAGHAAGVTTILIDYGYAEALRPPPPHRVHSLQEAVTLILDLP